MLYLIPDKTLMIERIGNDLMKLKTKLVVAFFTIIFVPVILIIVSFFGFGRYQLRSIQEIYGVEDASYESIYNPMQVFNQYTKEIHTKINDISKTDPEFFEDSEYLDAINKELKNKHSYLVVRKDEELIYIGSDSLDSSLETSLPPYGNYKTNIAGGIYIGENTQALVKQVDFDFSDSTKGSVFIVTSVGDMIPQIKLFIIEMLITSILILIFTAVILIAWIYKGIVTPMRRLKEATQKIKDGNLDFVLDSGSDDEIGELCADFEDMRRKLKESAEEKLAYDRENKELITNISHDLKTPITAVKGYVEGIMDGVADTPEKMDKYIKTIYNKANDMDRLINELTFYTKIDTNKIPYTFTKIKVGNYFDDCIEEVGFELESKGIELAYFNYVEEDTQIIADAEQLKKVINNIIGNSIKYMDKEKRFINIRIKDVGDFVQVEIEDNGKGIGRKELSYIFDRFYRTDASRNSAQGGSGIGLSIVKKIIEDHGGKIWATSRETAGTAIYFVLRKYQEVPQYE